MSEAVRRLLVAYDISEDRRRDRAAALLGGFGERVQYSVFLVDGRPADLVRLRGHLKRLIDPETDRVMLCDLGPRGGAQQAIVYLGRTLSLVGDGIAVIV